MKGGGISARAAVCQQWACRVAWPRCGIVRGGGVCSGTVAAAASAAITWVRSIAWILCCAIHVHISRVVSRDGCSAHIHSLHGHVTEVIPRVWPLSSICGRPVGCVHRVCCACTAASSSSSASGTAICVHAICRCRTRGGVCVRFVQLSQCCSQLQALMVSIR